MLGFVSHPECLAHDPGPLHPDQPRRLMAIQDRLIASGLDMVVEHFDAPLANRADLVRVHARSYVDRMLPTDPDTDRIWIDADTVVSHGTLRAARRAAGAGILGVDLVMDGRACPVFCAVRPPGHHATRDNAMGGCIFNNIAVAAAYALKRYRLERVAIADFDVHHGNGTEQIFAGDPRILVCSSFQHPYYPFSGATEGAGNVVAAPLEAGTGGPAFRAAISERWLPALRAFAPQLVMISAGFDGHARDEMSDISLTETDFGWITGALAAIAAESAAGRIVSMLEGGYEPDALGRSVEAHLKALMP